MNTRGDGDRGLNEGSGLDSQTGAGASARGSASTGGSIAVGPFVLAVLDTVAYVGDGDRSSIQLVDSDDLVNGGGSDSVTLVGVMMGVPVTLSCSQRTGGS